MKITRSLAELRAVPYHEPSGVAIGTFDGVHLGHQQVIQRLSDYCKQHQWKSVVYTFANHPREFTNKDVLPNRILTLEEKIDFFEHLNIDELIMVEFDEVHMNIDSRDFVEKILCKHLNMKFLAAGYNFRFGSGAQGDGEFLKKLGVELGYQVQIVEPYIWMDEPISSTRIRNDLREGKIEQVNVMLGRHHTVTGQVAYGKRLGRTLGYPTANLKVSPNMTLIMPGVYVTRTWVGKQHYHSVTNVGFNPTFSQHEFNLETYILEYSEDLYHKFITVEFLHRLREEKKYNQLEKLVEQIGKDVEDTKKYFRAHRQRESVIMLPLAVQNRID